MATWGPTNSGDNARTYPTRQPGRWKRNLVIMLVLVLAGWLAWAWQGLREEALVGTAYAADVGCVCRFVSGRDLAACEGDLKSTGLSGAARLVSLSEDSATRTVRASVPFLAGQSADFRDERGCQLEPWKD